MKVAELTVGGTLGAKWALELLGNGFSAFLGVSLEVGVRQTLNYETGQVENEGVYRFRYGASGEVQFLGREVSARAGPDTGDHGGPVGRAPEEREDMNIELAGQYPAVGPGLSATYTLNPFAGLSQLLPRSRLPIG